MQDVAENVVDLRTHRRNIGAERVDRLPPHDHEAEQGVLGCIMLDPQSCMPECVERIRDADVWYDLKHRAIWENMIELYEDNVPIDAITLQDRLKAWGKLDECGGLAYILSLQDIVPSASNVSYYLNIICEKHTCRKVIQVCTGAVERVYSHDGETSELVDEVERDILTINSSRIQPAISTAKELVKRSILRMQDRLENKGAVQGIPTGFSDIDRMTGGLKPGEMVVISARPSMGKTSLAMNIAEHVSVDLGLPVGVFSLEMTADALMDRMLSSRARVNQNSLRDGQMAERDFPKITHASAKLSKAPLFIDDTSGLSIIQIRAKARRMWQQHGIRLFVIDYLQLANATGGKRRVENRQQEISDISSGIKSMAKELSIPVIVLAQMNRDIEREKNRKPRLSDIRESGSVEQDGDIIAFLYKPAQESEDSVESEASQVNLLIAKQRNGPTGEVPLTFLKGITRFESASKLSGDDIPECVGSNYNNE